MPTPRVRPSRAAAVTLLLAALWSCAGSSAPLPDLSPLTLGDTTGLLARGEYLVRTVSNCGHCHAADPRDSDGALIGGYAFRNWRLGTIRASNLTPDTSTGLGGWSEAEIVRAIRTGEDRDGEVLAPVMPYAWFSGMTLRDALAIARYLKSTEPVEHEVENDPNLVYHVAELLFLGPEEPVDRAVAPRGATVENGRYLALHVALCADCHTPRGGLQNKPDMDLLFAGSDAPPAGFPANPSNITPDSATGIGTWSEEAFLRTLRTGVTPDGEELHRFMPWEHFRDMAEDDLRAIYRYLRTVPPVRHEIADRQAP